MRRLRHTVAVDCPIDQAQARIERFFTSRRGAHGVIRFPLRLPLEGLPIEGLALDHEICVETCARRDEQNLNDLIRLKWRPSGDVPLPEFDGTIVTWAESDRNRTFIELDGTYAAPLAAAGEIFDETVGRAIAQRTAAELLTEIAASIAEATMPDTSAVR